MRRNKLGHPYTPQHRIFFAQAPVPRAKQGLAARRAGGAQTALRPPDRRGSRVLGWAEEAAAKSELLRNVGAAAASRSEPLDAACAPGEGHDEYRAGERAQLCREARQASTRPVEQCR